MVRAVGAEALDGLPTSDYIDAMVTLALASASRRRIADVVLASVVLLIVGMMIVPLPTALLDILLAGNIALGVLMLLTALYVRSGLEFSAFPTVLLVTTLFRLALNVSSTRLVLLQADAGDVIRAFGDFVVRGNYVVGFVIFALLTLIQFLVIAKGSERVAEVGARFTLDAMPGKQMSIDAELRTGAIDQATARLRRSALSRESQFYGAMDGAMKFVKGDAIAGIVITFVNLLGGLVVGVWMHSMSAPEALRTYGLLTIGDGLVSQIPALLISTAAGLVVTRVASEDPHSSLGADVATQVFGQPRALVVAGGFLLLLAVIPGLPAVPFLVLGGLSLGLGMRLARSEREAQEAETETGRHLAWPRSQTPGHAAFVPVVAPLGVDLGLDAHALATDAGLESSLGRLREKIFASIGLPLPTVRIRKREDLPPGRVVVYVQEIEVSSLEVSNAEPAEAWVTRITFAVESAARRRAEELLGLHETQQLLDALEKVYPALVKNVVPKPVPLTTLTEVLRRLVGEGVGIRALREILESLSTYAPLEKDPVELVELVRASLRRQVVARHVMDGSLPVLLVDPTIEETIRDAVRRTGHGSYLALAPDNARDIVEAARRAFGLLPAGKVAVLLAQTDVRRYLRRLLESELPEVAVLAYAELPPDLVVSPLGRVEPGDA